MAGFSAALPFRKDPNDGFALLVTINEVASQNLKMLLFTEPGERVFDPNFGVGIKRYLFEQNVPRVHETIVNKIQEQVSKYLPYINIIEINISTKSQEDDILQPDIQTQNLNIFFKYQITGFSGFQTLQI